MSSSSLIDTPLTHLSTLYHALLRPYLPTPLATTLESLLTLLANLTLPILRSGDLPSIAALLVILYLSLRTLDYIRRSLMGWVVFVVKMGLLLGLGMGAWYVSVYGWERALREVGWVGGVVWGVVEGAWEGAGGDGAGAGGYGRRGRGRADRWNVSGARQQAWGTGGGAGAGAGAGRGRNRWT